MKEKEHRPEADVVEPLHAPEREAQPTRRTGRGVATANPSDVATLTMAVTHQIKPVIFELLARNSHPTHMAALCAGVGPGILSRMEVILDENEWARARGYLGDQISLERRIGAHDGPAVLRDLERLTDVQALALFTGSPATLEQIRDQLSGEELTRAMRLLLDKADRALRAGHGNAVAPPGIGPHDFTLVPHDIRVDGKVITLITGGALDPVAEQRVRMVEERIRAADAAGNAATAFLALGELDAEERKALAVRIRDRPLAGARLLDLAELATQVDDATVLTSAIVRAQYEHALNRQAAAGLDLSTALQRLGDLVRRARLRVQTLPPDAPAAERDAAHAELARLEQMLFGDGRDAHAVRGVLREISSSDPRAYAEQLRTLAADPVTVGRELLAMVGSSDADALIEVLKLIPAEVRRNALEAAGRIGDLSAPWLSEDKRELLRAYVDQGRSSTLEVAGSVNVALEPSPEATIALHEILEAMTRAPATAGFVLARLARLASVDHKDVVTDQRFQAKLAALPAGDIDEADFKEWLGKAALSPRDAELAVLHYPSGPGHPGQAVRLEEARQRTDEAGGTQVMRRGYVLEAQIAAKRLSEGSLSAADQLALAEYRKIQAFKPLFDSPEEKGAVDEIALGQPSLLGTDPNMEAEFMRIRLHRAAKVPDDASLSSWDHDRPSVVEVLAEFDAAYRAARPGGVSPRDLAKLAEIYYRASDEIARWDREAEANEGLARMAATVAGVVVAVTVTAVTGGALGPVALGALAGISAGSASAIAGAAVRWEDSAGSILKDFGGGAVEGIAMVAGAGLAARVVHGASAGMSAGRAAATAAGQAARAGGSVAAHLAEAAIDGAIGGAAGELFQTAVDEATWDRGVATALARMLVAIARGAGMGAAGGVAGGAIGGLVKLAQRHGQDVAHGVGSLFDAAGVARRAVDEIGDHARDELAHAFSLLEGGNLEGAELVVGRIAGIGSKDRALLVEAMRARIAARSGKAGEEIVIEGQALWPRIVDEKEFREIAGHHRADAMVVIEQGRPQIIARRGASPQSIREEVAHVHQWYGEPGMRERMMRLGADVSPTEWAGRDVQQRLQRHIDKAEVEVDAQRRVIAQLEHEAGEDPAIAMQVRDADETMFLLTQRLEQLRAARMSGGAIDAAKLGLDEVPHLFSKGAKSGAQVKGGRARKVRSTVIKAEASIDDGEVQDALRDFGYVLHREGGKGRIFRITRHPDHSSALPHLTLRGRTIVEGEGVLTFAERKSVAGHDWVTSQAHVKELQKLNRAARSADPVIGSQLAAYGLTVREKLTARVANGELDAESAGLVAKWGQVVEQLKSDSRGKYTIEQFFESFPKKTSFDERDVDKIRRDLRTAIVDHLAAVEAADKRMERLHVMLDLQPDSGSKGELFSAYRERYMQGDAENFRVLDDVAGFGGRGISKPRRPDGAVEILDEIQGLPPGRYAVEDKAGKGAFDLNQARDYAKRSYESVGGFKSRPNDNSAAYDGLVYVFSKRSEAISALSAMSNDAAVIRVLEKRAGGIHVGYFDEKGNFSLLTVVKGEEKT